jgi:hypothetical protein
METTSTNQTPLDSSMGSPQVLPNSTAVLVLGIISIALCWCYGIIGLTTGIIALALGSKGDKLYKSNPTGYTEGSYKNMKAGKICAIIGTCLSGVYFLFIIIYFLIIGAAIGSIFSTMPWESLKQL